MTILESLFRPTAKDQLSGINQRRWYDRTIFNLSAGILVSGAGDAVARDTLRIVEGVSILATPGAAQFVRYITAYITRNGVDTQLVFATPESDTVVKPYGYTWLQMELPMMLGEFLNYRATFNAGVAANQVDAFAWGYEIPRGNFEGN